MKRVSFFHDADTWHAYSDRMAFPADEQAKFITALASRLDGGAAFSAFVAKACVKYASDKDGAAP